MIYHFEIIYDPENRKEVMSRYEEKDRMNYNLLK